MEKRIRYLWLNRKVRFSCFSRSFSDNYCCRSNTLSMYLRIYLCHNAASVNILDWSTLYYEEIYEHICVLIKKIRVIQDVSDLTRINIYSDPTMGRCMLCGVTRMLLGQPLASSFKHPFWLTETFKLFINYFFKFFRFNCFFNIFNKLFI